MKSKQGDLTYLIELDYGLIVRRHIDQIQARTTDQKQGSGEVSTPAPEPDRFDLPIDLNPDLPSEDPGGEQSTTNCTVRGIPLETVPHQTVLDSQAPQILLWTKGGGM